MKRSEFIKSGIALTALPAFMSFSSMEKGEENVLKNFSKNNDWDIIRKQFLIEKELAYLNNGTMGINPRCVVDELKKQFEYTATKGHYPGGDEMNKLKSKLGSVIGVDAKTLAITKNVTEGINIACFGQNLKAGEEVIMTTHEHVGGCASWLYRSKKEGIVIKTFALGNTAEETFENLKKTITSKTRVIAVPHIPCTIGQILPAKEICEYARKNNITTILDGAHPLGMIRLNIAEIGCDYYTGCLHKWLLGPIGMGFIYVRPDLLDQTNIYNIGAYSIGAFDMTSSPPSFDKLVDETQRYSSGTFCGPAYLAAIKAIEWYEGIGIDKVESRVKQLSLYTQESLKKFGSKIKILSPSEERSRGAQTTFQFTDKKSSEFVGFAKQDYKVVTRHVHEGKMDAIRISTHYYNSESQIDKLMKAVDAYIRS